jgi:hypothetical protein
MIINLAGTTFLDDETKKALADGLISVDDPVRVEQMGDQKENYDADFAIYSWNNLQIGWIPQLKTIKKYIGKELENGNRDKHDMQYQRYKIVEKIRGFVTVDIHRNENIPQGTITNILSTDNGYSISVNIEH